MKTTKQWINELQLESHPEGGFIETIRVLKMDTERRLQYLFYLQMTIFAFHRIDADSMVLSCR